jgi:hypothetical protein
VWEVATGQGSTYTPHAGLIAGVTTGSEPQLRPVCTDTCVTFGSAPMPCAYIHLLPKDLDKPSGLQSACACGTYI